MTSTNKRQGDLRVLRVNMTLWRIPCTTRPTLFSGTNSRLNYISRPKVPPRFPDSFAKWRPRMVPVIPSPTRK